MTCCTSKQKLIILIVTGILVIAIGCACIPLFEYLIQEEIKKNVVLVPGSQTYDNFLKPAPEIFMQFYVFHLTNPNEVAAGAKIPAFEQRGPYTYREFRKKIDIVHNDNGTITYRQVKTWHFLPDKSNGSETETFTTANLVLMTVAESVKRFPGLLKLLISGFAKILEKETLFVNKTVHEIIWGYNDTLLHNLHIFLPNWFVTDVVGTNAGKNDTTDGLYTVFSGKNNITILGAIDQYNGSRYLNFWTSRSANLVYGTDGTLCPPFITKDMVLTAFSTEICRSIPGTYQGDVFTPQGIKLWRFSGTKHTFASGDNYPPNAGYCVPRGHCLKDGLLNISTCQLVDGFHVPIVISQPHFYHGDPKLIDAVVGLKPDPEQHRTEIDVQPDTGIVMKAAKRLQINLYIETFPNFMQLKDIKTVVFPILWVDENFVIDDKNANMYKQMVEYPILATEIVKYAIIGIGGLILITALGYGIYLHQRRRTAAPDYQNGYNETSPLINDNVGS